jgi:hypothetical protein
MYRCRRPGANAIESTKEEKASGKGSVFVLSLVAQRGCERQSRQPLWAGRGVRSPYRARTQPIRSFESQKRASSPMIHESLFNLRIELAAIVVCDHVRRKANS